MDKNANDEEYVSEEDFETGGEVKRGSKIKAFLESRYYFVAILILIAIISFALGKASASPKKTPVRVVNEIVGEVKGVEINNADNPNIQVVGSKSGSKYHRPDCPGAKQISEKNLIKFNSVEEARAKGYTPAANCKGLQ